MALLILILVCLSNRCDVVDVGFWNYMVLNVPKKKIEITDNVNMVGAPGLLLKVDSDKPKENCQSQKLRKSVPFLTAHSQGISICKLR